MEKYLFVIDYVVKGYVLKKKKSSGLSLKPDFDHFLIVKYNLVNLSVSLSMERETERLTKLYFTIKKWSKSGFKLKPELFFFFNT